MLSLGVTEGGYVDGHGGVWSLTLIYLPLVAGMGSVSAYWQGRALQQTRFMAHVEQMQPLFLPIIASC